MGVFSEGELNAMAIALDRSLEYHEQPYLVQQDMDDDGAREEVKLFRRWLVLYYTLTGRDWAGSRHGIMYTHYGRMIAGR